MSADRTVALDGLTCYTANLAAYLHRTGFPDGDDRIADSVRLAADLDRPDGLIALSHHHRPLHDLDDGTGLSYRGIEDCTEMLAVLEGQLEAHRAALVVGHGPRLPWAATAGGAAAEGDAPHLLLVDDHRGDRWHVVDRFGGVMASGAHQQPYAGWITEADLCGLVGRSRPTSIKHRLRNQLAFGFPIAVPDDTTYLIVVRDPSQPQVDDLGARWITDTSTALRALGDRLADPEALLADPEVIDDCWAAAQHHIFRYRRLAADPSRTGTDRDALCAAIGSWSRVPSNVRFALDSARRNRPRPTLVQKLFADVAAADAAARAVVPAPTTPAAAGSGRSPVNSTPPVPSEIGVLSEIAALIGRRRGGPTPQLQPETGLEEGLRMNSAQVVDLLSELEEHFDCVVRDDDLDSLTHVGDLVAIVERGAAR